MTTSPAIKAAQILSFQVRQVDTAEWTSRYNTLASATSDEEFAEALSSLRALWWQVISAARPELAANGMKGVRYTGDSFLAGYISAGEASAPIRMSLGSPSAVIFQMACDLADSTPGSWKETVWSSPHTRTEFTISGGRDNAQDATKVLARRFTVLGIFREALNRSTTSWSELHEHLNAVRDIRGVADQSAAYLAGMKELAGAWEQVLLTAQGKLAAEGVEVSGYPGSTIFAAKITMDGHSAALRMDFADPEVSILTLMRDLSGGKPASYGQRFDEWTAFMADRFGVLDAGKTESRKVISAQAMLQAAVPDLAQNMPFAFRATDNERRILDGLAPQCELQVMNRETREVEWITIEHDERGVANLGAALSDCWESDLLPTW